MRGAECEEKDCYQGEDCTGIRDQVIEAYEKRKQDLEIARTATFLEGGY